MEKQQAYLESESPESAWDWAVAAASAEVAPTRDPRIEDYLDRVGATLVRQVPYDRRQELRAELGRHLDLLIAQLRARHTFGGDAVAAALRRFGSPRRLGRRWLHGWSGARGHVSLARLLQSPVWKATLISLACFTGALLPAVGYLLVDPSKNGGPGALDALRLAPWSPLLGHWPFRYHLGTSLCLGTTLPLCAGLAVGWLARSKAVWGTLFAASLLALGLLGVSHLVSERALRALWVYRLYSTNEFTATMAAIVFSVWMPIGCAAAALGFWLRQRRDTLPAPPDAHGAAEARP